VQQNVDFIESGNIEVKLFSFEKKKKKMVERSSLTPLPPQKKNFVSHHRLSSFPLKVCRKPLNTLCFAFKNRLPSFYYVTLSLQQLGTWKLLFSSLWPIPLNSPIQFPGRVAQSVQSVGKL
jgi:hypothetical protein